MESLAPATIKQYDSVYRTWWTFCEEQKCNPFAASVNDVLIYFKQKFDEGASYGSLNSARAALGNILEIDFSSQEIVSRFFKGVFRKRPSKPKYSRTWDPSIVLNFIEKWFPLETLSFQELTEKTIVLLALTTAHRVQTFSTIDIQNIIKKENLIEIEIPDSIKTSGPGKYQPLLILPRFDEKPELCVALTIENYLERTKTLRGPITKLFITCKKPYRAATSQTISRWIKSALVKSGLDVSIFKGHSTRHASTSKAFAKGLDLNQIRSTAGWTHKSQVFAKFYNKPISSDSGSFAKLILEK